jgi:hypothetical protein
MTQKLYAGVLKNTFVDVDNQPILLQTAEHLLQVAVVVLRRAAGNQ